jgi:hypothetical protein
VPRSDIQLCVVATSSIEDNHLCLSLCHLSSGMHTQASCLLVQLAQRGNYAVQRLSRTQDRQRMSEVDLRLASTYNLCAHKFRKYLCDHALNLSPCTLTLQLIHFCSYSDFRTTTVGINGHVYELIPYGSTIIRRLECLHWDRICLFILWIKLGKSCVLFHWNGGSKMLPNCSVTFIYTDLMDTRTLC